MTAERESGLPSTRLRGELERTCVQLEMFADVVVAGEHLEVIIDPADPEAKPAPRPDLRRMLISLGPVAVFGASNFLLAFSTARRRHGCRTGGRLPSRRERSSSPSADWLLSCRTASCRGCLYGPAHRRIRPRPFVAETRWRAARR